METHQLADVSVNEAEEDLGNLSIDNMFESFSDDLNLARVVEVEDEIDGDDVKEVGVLLSKQRLGKSFNDSEEDEESSPVVEDAETSQTPAISNIPTAPLLTPAKQGRILSGLILRQFSGGF